MRFGVAALLSLILALPATAATLKVQSGEHADFTRIVVLYREVPDWTFGRVSGGFELRTARPDDLFDLSQVFALIPRTRIEAMESRPDGRLFLSVPCDCHGDIFQIRGGLVIDIKDGPAGANARFEAALPEPDRAMPEPEPRPEPVNRLPREVALIANLADHHRATRSELAWQDRLSLDLDKTPPGAETVIPVTGMAAEPMPDPAPVEKPAMPDEGPMAGDTGHADTMGDDHLAAADTAGDMSTPPERDEARVAELRQALIEQLGRAAAQGLVEADLSETEERVADAYPGLTRDGHAAMPGDPAEEVQETPVRDPRPTDHVRFETAIDRGHAAVADIGDTTNDGLECLPDSMLAILEWGHPPVEGGPLSLSRSGLVGEFDKADTAGVEALAKNYIYLTFGAEAQALLGAFDTGRRNTRLLVAMAEIMDGIPVSGDVLSIDQAQCDGRVALWSVLANPSISKGDPITSSGLRTGFAELPLHLRRHLGPTLVDRLLQAGDADSASFIRDSLARAPGDHGEGFLMLDAQLSFETGKPGHGAEQLAGIVRDDGPRAPEALVQLIDTRLDSGIPVDDKMMRTADSMAFEARGTEMGAELRRAYLRALAHTGDYPAALKAIAGSAADQVIAAETADALRYEVLGLATADPEDEAFLSATIPWPGLAHDGEDAIMLRRSAAARMIAVGLTKPARDILSEDSGVPGPEDRRLFARSYLAERRPELAMGYLAGLNDDDAKAMRARIHDMAGEFDRAATIFEQIGDETGRARASWRGRDLDSVRDIGTGPEKAVAELILQPATDETSPPLARNRDLIARSETTRRLLSDLLAPPSEGTSQ